MAKYHVTLISKILIIAPCGVNYANTRKLYAILALKLYFVTFVPLILHFPHDVHTALGFLANKLLNASFFCLK